MTSTPRPSTTARTVARPLLVVAALTVAAYVVWTVPGVRPRPGFDRWYDGALQGSGYVLVAAVAVLGAWNRGTGPASRWVAGAISLRAAGFVITLTGLALGHVPSYPSPADAAWVLSGLALFVALTLRLRALSPRVTGLAVLDGVAASLLALGVAINVLDGPVRALTAEGVPRGAVTMNVLYPVLDTALLMVVAALITVRHRLTRSDLVLVAGVIGLVVVDIMYLLLLAKGLWRPGTLLASFSLVTTCVMAGAAITSQAPLVVHPRRPGQAVVPDPPPGVTVPAVLVGSLLVVLAASGFATPALGPALVCYGAAGALAITRGVLTVRSIRDEADRVVGEASFDVRLFKSLVDASGDFIGMADERGRPLYINPSGLRMLGLPARTDVTTLDVGRLAPGATSEEFPRRWRALLREGQWAGLTELVPVDGSPPVPVDIRTFVLGAAAPSGRRVAGTIQRDVSERLRAEQELSHLAEQRAQLLDRLVQAEDGERARIAHDVHDDPVQALAAVDLRLGLLRRRLEDDAPDVVEDVDLVQEIVAGATERLRNLLFDLESLPEGTTLAQALDEAAGFIFGGTDVRVEVVGEPDLALPDAQRVTAHRIVKEALANACKHAGAGQVVVTLEHTDEAAVVSVDDDGRGIGPDDEDGRPGHLGLRSMRDRAQVAGAVLEVGRREEGGTRVRLSFPLPVAGDDTPRA